ncbi:mechanosensitive ion channel family protein [Cryomorphaceae bacterium 1068]|nr:mechanosensitive ion channel family protein [Cryomorphaceae bacterium 1068]
MRNDPTHYVFLKNALRFLIVLTALIVILYTIPELKELGLSLFAGAGIVAAIIGFASQAAFSNIVSGVFLVVFKPFRVGDVVTVKNDMLGIVEDITLRHTIIKDFENKRYVIPNSMIDSEVIHNSAIMEEEIGNFLYIHANFDADLDQVIRLIREEAEKHPVLTDPRTDEQKKAGEPKIDVRVLGWRDYYFELRAQVWSKDHISGFELKTDLYKSISERFRREGIEIPVPAQNIKLKNNG